MTSSVGTRRSRCDPQLVDDLEADGDRLGRVAEPAEVHHRDAVATGDDVRGGRQVARPHLPLEQAEVLHPPGEATAGRGCRSAARASMAPMLRRRPICARKLMKALYSSWSRTGSSCSVAAWAWRVIVRNRIRSGSSPSRARGVAAQHPHAALGDPPGVGLRHPGQRRAEVHEVGVRVEDGHPQVGLQQEPLEQHPEGVGLARAALPAQERVPVEPAGPQARLGADVTRAPRADRHRAGGRAVQAAELGGPGELQGGPAEGRPVAALHRAGLVQGADDDTEPGQRRRRRPARRRRRPGPGAGPPRPAVMTTMSPGATPSLGAGPEREAPPVAGLGPRLARGHRHGVLLSRPTGRDGRVDVVPPTSWRMPCPPPPRPPAVVTLAASSMTASRGTPQHTWSPRA